MAWFAALVSHAADRAVGTGEQHTVEPACAVAPKQVRDAIEREVELRLELNHRIKNILASVSSIFQMTRRGAVTVEELAKEFAGRLQALSKVHTAVFEAGEDEVALSSIVELTVSPYNSDGLSRIHARGPDVSVSRNSATTIALCLHELITNAIKYGALSQKDGSVNIVWTILRTPHRYSRCNGLK